MAEAVVDLVEEKKKLTPADLVGEHFAPNMLCLTPGDYALVRRGEIVERFDGKPDLVTVSVGQRFPPGLATGDRWRKIGL